MFHFSGHGTRQIDYNHDEVDGYDEALCPLDHETEGNIIDDEINDTIVRPLPRGATLHAILDACYSGTALDLPFVCRMNKSVICKISLRELLFNLIFNCHASLISCFQNILFIFSSTFCF